ncbi:hypothetical protein L1785_16880 [Antribacter sp. KLBMP9083]|uniref:Uncharacterized protein n=1 Tax=Antribacter soli TaxID=2910976 RepID=A0AA41U8P4_9MICO|nr:hypothetical protein [Antribacter soli]MCF4122655.1 hypothetical protein [Antribacter soli]
MSEEIVAVMERSADAGVADAKEHPKAPDRLIDRMVYALGPSQSAPVDAGVSRS